MTGFDSNFDVKSLGKVAVLMGGDSAEREVSLMSGSGVLRGGRPSCLSARRLALPYSKPSSTTSAAAAWAISVSIDKCMAPLWREGGGMGRTAGQHLPAMTTIISIAASACI